MTAPAPGITVTTALSSPPPIPNVPTATWFVTGLSQRGKAGKAISIQSMSDFNLKCGSRTNYASLYDALDLFFRDGGQQAYVSRVVGPAAVASFVILQDRASTPIDTIKVWANSVGAWGNQLTVQVVAGSLANTYQLVIGYNGATVETSPNLSSPQDAVNWAAALSNYVTITDLASTTAAPNNNPAVVSATPLTSGADDNAAITETHWTTALTVFAPDMGPGQVSAPGRTTDAAHQALLAHAATNNRTALLDAVDTATASTLITAATAAVTGGLDGSRGCLCAPWVTIPGIQSTNGIPSPARSVAPSALFAATIARSDIASGTNGGIGVPNQNIAAAGAVNGASKYAIGVSQAYSDTDRGTLNAAGVNVIRQLAGVVQVYGFRTLSLDPQWYQLNWARLRMAIQNDGQAIAASVAEFATIDAKGQLLGRLNGQLAGMLQAYWQVGALYGNSATDAFVVDTSSQVNTAATAAAGQVLATLSVRRSAMAEYTQISILNVPLTEQVPSSPQSIG
jgi:hypothetical protein